MSPKVISGIITTVVMAVIVGLMLLFGYNPPDPPIPEEGVEVNVGDADFGEGDNPEPSNEAASYAPPAARNEVATQRTEPAPAMQSSTNPGNITNPNSPQETKVENKEPEINSNALFRGNRNKNNGGSQGNTTGAGNQGSPNGTPNSDNYTGNGGTGGTYNLKGRNAVSLPKPSYNSNAQGKVVVKIWVDQQGRVTRVEAPYQGTTITQDGLVEQAKAAARKARFNASSSAPEEQTGTITYIFKI